MTWTLCRKVATHRLIGAVVSFTRCGSSIVATTSEEVWEGLGQCARGDWYMDADRGLVAFAPRSGGKYVVRHTGGRALRVSVNPMIREKYLEQLRGKRFELTLGDQPGVGRCAFFSVHQHDASVPVENKPTPAMRAAGREAIAAYVQAHAVHNEPVTADVARTIGADHGLTAAEATRVMQAALSELAEARAAERRGKG
jgi:hypothetical protein